MAYRQKEYNYNDKLTKDQNLLMDKLYKMRMSGMAEAFENQLMNPNSGLESFETRFSEIINHEWSGRENKKFNRLLKQATLKYPAADLDSSLYDPERQLNTHVIELLAKGDWIDEPNNLLITGGAGAGKTHIACALCVTALHQMRNFTHLDGIFDNRLRYCPICMKSGYHSFLHQLYFLDECFIHQKTPLLYRCSCINTYILKRKRIADVTAFQCEQCDKKIAVAPSMSDGILEFWRKDNICKRLRRINKYKKINIVDVLLLYQEKGNSFHRYTEFSTTQKAVLKDLILTGKTKQTPRLFIVRDLAESTHKIVMSEALNQYILNKYEHNVILKHFWHISDRYCRYEIGEHNIELLSIFFLIKELQCKSYVDQLNYGLRRDLDGNIKRIFLSDNEYSDAIFLIQRISFQLGIDIDDYIELYNFILMEFTLARYKHIYSCFRDNHPSEYPCTSAASVSYNNWNYPVYIIVKNKEDEILLY